MSVTVGNGKEYDIDFRANTTLGDRHNIAFGLASRHMNLEVEDVVTPPLELSGYRYDTRYNDSFLHGPYFGHTYSRLR